MKKILGSLLGIIALGAVCISAGAEGLTVDPIKFTKANGDVLTSRPTSSQAMYVTTTVDNASAEDKYLYMLVCEYLDVGVKTYSSYYKVDAGATDVPISVEAFVTNSESKVLASIIDKSYMIDSFINTAEFLSNSTDLDYIKVNGKEIEDYSDTKNRYKVTVDTQRAAVEVGLADSSQSYTVTDRKLPAVVPVKVISQLGDTRVIELEINTTNPGEVEIVDPNMIMWLVASNNEGMVECNPAAKTWVDISGFGTDMEVKDFWIKEALVVSGNKSDSSALTQFPQKVVDVINTNNFTIKFTLDPEQFSQDAYGILPIMGSDNLMMKLYVPKGYSTVHFAWGNFKMAGQMPKVNISDVLSGENAIVVDGTNITWYVNGVQKAQKAIALVNNELPQADRLTLSYIDDKATGAGSFGITDIKIYNKALTGDELAGE